MFVYTTAIRKLRKLKKRIKVIQGGTSAGKTYGILPILIDVATKTPLLEISVVSESIPHLRRGAIKDFIKIMKETGRWIETHFNRTLLTYTFSNGSYIEFFSADQEGKVRGPRRNILYINECNNISFTTYHQLAIRTDGTIWLDFNPTARFWVHEELENDPDADWEILTYKDNEALAPSIIKEIEKGAEKALNSSWWLNWWRVYGLGLVGALEGVIFTNWKKLAEIPANSRLLGYAIDFGFTNDPTAILSAHYIDGRVVWHEHVYETGLTNSDIAAKLKEIGATRRDLIVADSAEPKSIAEIERYNFSLTPAVKGQDSVDFGIGIMQENEFYVTEESTNLISELRKYSWDRDKTGKRLNTPIDDFNHCIDAMRYFYTARLSKTKSKKKGIKILN